MAGVYNNFGESARRGRGDDRNNQWRGNKTRPPSFENGSGRYSGRGRARSVRDPENRNHFSNDSERSQSGNGNCNRRYIMGFMKLSEIAGMNKTEVLTKINEEKQSFMGCLESPKIQPDFYILIMEIIKKICECTFHMSKLKFILDICNSIFIERLQVYLMNLQYYVDTYNKKYLYWRDPDQFWNNVITFYECVVLISPSTAIQKCRSLIEGATTTCLNDLNKKHGYNLPEEYSIKLEELRNRLTECEKEVVIQSELSSSIDNNADEEPPEDFRTLSILPTREDLLETRPFLRPNIIQGGYKDIEHYLDVQFRLIREDCYGPLRNGIKQFINDTTRKRYDNIRIYRNVKVLGTYVSQRKIGTTIEFDGKGKSKKYRNINWAHSKRLLYGSLLLFTHDNCNSFVIGTVMERDVKFLAQGRVPVLFVEGSNSINENILYSMIESEVYFEPYLHLLRTLSSRNFSQNIAMSRYIVNVEVSTVNPKYLSQGTRYAVDVIPEICSPYFTRREMIDVLNPTTWPSAHDLGLNISQYEAYKLALTQELAVIQGPPGTGKTYLAVKIARTLIENFKSINVTGTQCMLLVICYTNHALDQFLEAILTITDSVIRIGGQSRSENMKKYNISEHRNRVTNIKTNKLFFENKQSLRINFNEIKRERDKLDIIYNGVLDYQTMCKYFPKLRDLSKHYKDSDGDPLLQWLFENMETSIEMNNDDIEEESADMTFQAAADVDDDVYRRNEVDVDDLFSDDVTTPHSISTSFTLIGAVKKLHSLSKQNQNGNNNRLIFEMQYLRKQINVFKEMVARNWENNKVQLNSRVNLLRYTNLNRWALYFNLIKQITEPIKQKLIPLQNNQETLYAAYEETRQLIDFHILKQVRVIGITTSGAARLNKLMQALEPPIVIVEEAAEVLEAHIISSLSKSCQHLILIGDHQQLRPSAAHFHLAKHYNLEISLFERMIKNNIHSRRLNVQHRMRPEIAALITPSIYPDLANHPSVELFPEVRGMSKNLYFLSHNYEEEVVDDSSSRCNTNEADMTLCLANYLMQQGYEAEDITILAAYSGQMFYMRKNRANYAFLSKVKITVVDNYQGEESRIVLLSLVRNNQNDKIGFLGTENRVCVALSRAKEGFYIFGNIEILKRNANIWNTIASKLEANDSLGTTLFLKCESHPNELTAIRDVKDFEKVPEGGCLLKCNIPMSCGHLCPLVCHGYDRNHVNKKCPYKCERVICGRGHVCPLNCVDECKPCVVLVTKILSCKHENLVPCHVDSSKAKCTFKLNVTLPNCGHTASKFCFEDIKSVVCKVPCEYRIDNCGHKCKLYCHVMTDPLHEKYVCDKPCERAKKDCSANLTGDRGSHQCQKRCFETCDDCHVEVKKKRSKCTHSSLVACAADVDATPCRQKCRRMLECGHFCKLKCFEKCGQCTQKVKKVIPDCGHKVTLPCNVSPLREHCTFKCDRLMSCGHKCNQMCKVTCDPNNCFEIIRESLASPCGHAVFLPCRMYEIFKTGSLGSETLMRYCKAPCNQTLACEHACAGGCGACRQGRLHAPCARACARTLICGHECKVNCNEACPPCARPCEVTCPHSKCGRTCGEPCTPCTEPCMRRCVHGACKNRCGEPCDREPCEQRCPLMLSCSHPCRGLCGEPCPDICRVCRPEEFPKDFLGDDFEDDEKFIKFEDCSHVLDVPNMDSLMKGDKETISIRTCPYCRKPIINTHRYKDIVNDTIQSEINPIKLKVYGNSRQRHEKMKELRNDLSIFSSTYSNLIEGNEYIKRAYTYICNIKSKSSLLELNMHAISIDVLNILAENYTKMVKKNLSALRDDILNQIKLICEVLINNTHKISQQQQQDINNEVKRMIYVIQFSKMLSNSIYLNVKSAPEVMKAVTAARKTVLSFEVFNEDLVLKTLNELQRAIKLSGIVTKQERDLVVKAIGMKAGHWFKCPNGHFYCIGECGGAMQIGKCIECDAKIGGTNHSLLKGNRHAGEMDQSSYAAYSEEANNMANFDLVE